MCQMASIRLPLAPTVVPATLCVTLEEPGIVDGDDVARSGVPQHHGQLCEHRRIRPICNTREERVGGRCRVLKARTADGTHQQKHI